MDFLGLEKTVSGALRQLAACKGWAIMSQMPSSPSLSSAWPVAGGGFDPVTDTSIGASSSLRVPARKEQVKKRRRGRGREEGGRGWRRRG